jgi:hypothetical protein
MDDEINRKRGQTPPEAKKGKTKERENFIARWRKETSGCA